MKPLRLLAISLTVIGSVALAIKSESYLFPSILCGAALFSVVSPWTIPVDRFRMFIIAFVLALLFIVKWRALPTRGATAAWGMWIVALPVAQYTITLQVVFLHFRNARGLISVFPLLGTLALAMLGTIISSSGHDYAYHILAALYIVFMIAYYTRQSESVGSGPSALGRRVTMAAILLVILGVAIPINSVLKQNQRELDDLFNKLVNQAYTGGGTGFSGDARLGSIQSRKENSGGSTALRIYGDRAPGYMRGKAFDRYAESQWYARESARALPSTSLLTVGSPKRAKRFVLRSSRVQEAEEFTVWRDSSLRGTLFAPLKTVQLSFPTPTIQVDEHQIAESDKRVSSPHSAFVSPSTVPDSLDVVEIARFTQVPQNLDPGIERLAAKLFSDAKSVEDKVQAVEAFFLLNYEYTIGIEIPQDRDPLTYFLLEKPAAHCEYFASGAALLLRLGGVPSRYVTGFVTTEQNPAGGYWLARNRDAHAWVEAYDRDRGWFLVEATPPDGQPQASQSGALRYRWDAFAQQLKELRVSMAQLNFREAFAVLSGILVSISPILLLLVPVFIVYVGVKLKRRSIARVSTVDPHPRLHALLARMDTRTKRLGAERHPNETVSQFATRLRSDSLDQPEMQLASGWYRDYADLRFDPNTDVTLEELETAVTE